MSFDHVLSLLDVLLRWPLAALILGLTFMIMFQTPLRRFLERVTRGEVYGVRVEAADPTRQLEGVRETPQAEKAPDIERTIAERPKEALQSFLDLYRRYHYERTLNLIYGSQLALLDHLASKGTAGEAYINLLPFYNQYLQRGGNPGYQIAGYVDFLKASSMVEYFQEGSEHRVRITPGGLEFLSYLKSDHAYAAQVRPL